MASTANGTFDVTIRPGAAELDGAIGRFELSKTFHGDLQGTGMGVMLSAGDPQAGAAGYVAIETVRGRLGEHDGGFALQQFGSMHDGSQTLHYEVVPGSGTGRLAGITGTAAPRYRRGRHSPLRTALRAVDRRVFRSRIPSKTHAGPGASGPRRGGTVLAR